MSLIILSIETSCDETSAAILQDNKVLSNIISSQFFHKEYGGIVPELASRAHISSIDIIVNNAIKNSGVNKNDVNFVAATAGPGLIGSLLVGYNYARGFALSKNLPFIPVNHIESHLFSCFIGEKEVGFPFISLVVSGGHTILFHVKGIIDYDILGETQDDAAGEAFDKVAKMLGLEYPGGPVIDKLSEKGNENYHKFPLANTKDSIYDFSFSGIKTSVLYFLKKNFPYREHNFPINDICASFQKAVVYSLVEKTMLASKNYGIKTIAVSGGVSANSRLRKEFKKYENKGYKIFFPYKKYSTDNAAMIGYLAYLQLKYKSSQQLEENILKGAFARFKHRKRVAGKT
ncbi:MAG TPA: tRNA (adenosine(37)-N6)-threonylcarbamoyltransferase complex transferase subunit TsaD [Ignavibacteria bacterium]